MQDKATEEIAKDKDKWVSFMMKYELGLEQPDPKRATKSALNIGISYVVGGLVPLSPYFFVDSPLTGLKFSVVVTLICLFIFGWFKSKITGVAPFAGALRGAKVMHEPHVQFKRRVPAAIGLIRTGDTVQYANMILISG